MVAVIEGGGVGGSGVWVDGIGVDVAPTGVFVAGIPVAVAVGDSGVEVGGTGVVVGVGKIRAAETFKTMCIFGAPIEPVVAGWVMLQAGARI